MQKSAGSFGRERPVAALLVTFLLITLVAWLAGKSTLAQGSAPQAESSAPPAGPTAEEDINAAKAAIGKYRSGDDSVLPELRELVDRCARKHHRQDAQKLFDYYVGMPREARMRGVEQEAALERIRKKVKRAADEHMPSEDWKELRPQILDALGEIIDNNIGAPDVAPAARALALRATLTRQRVVRDDLIEEETRRSWIDNGIEDAEQSIKLFKIVGMQTPQLEPRWDLAWFVWAQRDWETAEQLFGEVLQLARTASNTEYQANALSGMLRIARESGNLQRCSELLSELARLGPEGLTWDVVKRHAELLLDLDEAGAAAELLVANKPRGGNELDEWHFLMQGVTFRAGLEAAARAHEAVLRDSPKAKREGSAEWIRIAELDLKEGKADAVLTRLNAAELPRIGLRRRASMAQVRGAALLALGRDSEAVAELRGALEMSDTLEAQLTESAGSTGSIVGERVGVENVAMLARSLIQTGDVVGAATAIENWQSRSLRLASDRNHTELSSESLRAWAARYELGLLTWAIGADTSVVVHVGRDGRASASILPLGRRGLEDAVRRLREAVINQDVEAAYRFGDEIQTAVLPSALVDELHAEGSQRILVCLHGPLELVPLDLFPLFRGEAGSSPIPITLPGLIGEASDAAVDPASWKTWSILGDPIAPMPGDVVPGASEELAVVADLHPDSFVSAGRDFTRGNLFKALQSGRCLHLASHLAAASRSGTSIDDSMSRAAIVLSGGERFTVDDIRNARPRLDLAVLNACYTAGGEVVDAEPMQGVTRAFLTSGTRNILVTLWPIEDQAARRFALAFHRALNGGLSPSRAAFVARNELRDSGAAPSDWAAFRVVGRD